MLVLSAVGIDTLRLRWVASQSHAAIGRCQAKLGQLEQASAAFEAAIEEALRCEFPFAELLARRDYAVHVLDKQGRRDSQTAALGGCIARMVLAAGEYTAVLGAGFDGEAAVARFRAEE